MASELGLVLSPAAREKVSSRAEAELVAPGRVERLDTAFFSANGALALLMVALYLLDMIGRA